MVEFNRRTYPSLVKALTEARKLMTDSKKIKEISNGNLIEKSFRERLMLAVTSVNRCRYCSYVHSKLALIEGVPLEEIRELHDGNLEKCPEAELPAILYAQHWAETGGNPELEASQNINNIYGKDKAQAIELTIRMINFANLIGNTFDLLLFKLTPRRFLIKGNPRTDTQ